MFLFIDSYLLVASEANPIVVPACHRDREVSNYSKTVTFQTIADSDLYELLDEFRIAKFNYTSNHWREI